ncbi:MAG: tetratricopeptide repeat protein [Planctomycetes bacterium]|nr:tetratricopeptide repeat protein [Planctomycetota bacterium]
MAVIVLVALALRLMYLGEIVDLPEFDAPAVDAGYHDYWAWGLAGGDWTPPTGQEDPRIQSTPFFRPPLCPYFLAAIYAVFGHSFLAVRLIQMLLGAVGCGLAYLLGRRLFDRPTATVCGLMMAGYWVFIYFDSELREVVLLVPIHLAIILGLLSLRRRLGAARALGCGALLGLAVLGKPNSLLFLPVAIGWLLAVDRHQPMRRAVLRSGVLLAVGCLAVVASATVRNAVVAGEAVLVSSNGGINLYIANNPRATGHDVRLPASLPDFDHAFDYPRMVRHVQRQQGRPMTHVQVSHHFAGLAWDYAIAEPGRTAGLVLKKAVLFWSGIEIVSEQDLNAARAESALLSRLPGNFAALLACGVVGMVLAFGASIARPSRIRWLGWHGSRYSGPRADSRHETASEAAVPSDRADLVLVLLFVGTYFVSFLPFFVTARYRVPITPFVVVFASFGLVRIASTLAQKHWALPAGGVAGMVVLYLLAGVDYYGVVDDGFKAKYDRAISYEHKGDSERATATYRQALAIRPHAPRAHNNLGIILARIGQTSQAIDHYRQALRYLPDYPEAHNNLGIELLQQDRPGEAIGHFAEAVRFDPDFTMAHKNYALALALEGRNAPAIDQYRMALQLDAGDLGARYNLAVLLARDDRLTEAATEFGEVLRRAPDHPRAGNELAAVQARLQTPAPGQ